MKYIVESVDASSRLDVFLMKKLKDQFFITRSALALYITDSVTVNDKPAKKGTQLKDGDIVQIDIEEIKERKEERNLETVRATPGELDIIEETDDYIVINKQSDVAVHPGKDNEDNTIANFLRFYLEQKNQYDPTIKRGGIVHRLDKLVSGILLCAKTREAQIYFQKQFEQHTVVKLYLASVENKDDMEGIELEQALETFKENSYEPDSTWEKVEGKIARDRVNRMRMILGDIGKSSLTYVLNLKGDEVLVNIKTGRMHQIRATLKSLGMVIKGDKLYGSESDLGYIKLKQILLRIQTPNNGTKEWSL